MTRPRPSGLGRLLMIVLAAGAACAASPRLLAQALVTPVQSGPWYKQVQLDLYVSASYSYNANHPADGTNAFRVFDFKDDRIQLDLAQLTVQKAVAAPGDFGFRIDAGAGQTQPEVTAARGLFRDPDTGEAGHFDVEQAYVSYVAPLGHGLRIDLGKFYAPIGYESVERYDAYNDNATHSFLFGYSAPFTTTGLKITYPFSATWSGGVMVVQGWDDVRDNNAGKSVGAQIAFTPSDKQGYYVNYIGGPEQGGNDSNWRNVYDFCGTWKVLPALTLGLNADYGHEKDALGPGRNGTWYGAAGYLVYGFTDRFRLAVRAERLDDRDGARTGLAEKLDEATLTPSYAIGKHVVVRGDLRMDWSDKRPFQKGDRFAARQPTVTLNLLLVY